MRSEKAQKLGSFEGADAMAEMEKLDDTESPAYKEAEEKFKKILNQFTK